MFDFWLIQTCSLNKSTPGSIFHCFIDEMFKGIVLYFGKSLQTLSDSQLSLAYRLEAGRNLVFSCIFNFYFLLFGPTQASKSNAKLS